MTDRTIEDLLGLLPEPDAPDPAFEARLRQRLTEELHAVRGDATSAITGTDRAETTEVFELESTGTTTTKINLRWTPATWLRATAAAAVVAISAALAVAALQDDGGEATKVTAPDATMVGARVDTIKIDQVASDPYFISVHDDAWVLSLNGDLIRIGDAGQTAFVTKVPEASPLAVDDDAVWVADAVDGRVLRLDPADGAIVAEIETGIEVLPSAFRVPMPEGASRQFALIGGIASNGESVWVGDRAGEVLRVDPETNEIADSFEVPVRPDELQIDGDHLLVVNRTGGQAVVVDSLSGELVGPTRELDDLAGAALSDGVLYLQDATDGTVTRIDLETGSETTSQPLGASLDLIGQPVLPTALIATASGVLVHTDARPDSVLVLDPDTLREIGTLAVEPDHGDMVVAPDGSAWVVRANAHEVVHITPRPI